MEMARIEENRDRDAKWEKELGGKVSYLMTKYKEEEKLTEEECELLTGVTMILGT